jgi:hypothetical protein
MPLKYMKQFKDSPNKTQSYSKKQSKDDLLEAQSSLKALVPFQVKSFE